MQNAKENLAYWDRELEVNRTRFKAGDLARVDLDRLELQRVQFESDFETAMVNLRTAKIQLLMLLNDRTPIEQFDVSGPFDFTRRVKAPGGIPEHRAGGTAGPEGRRAERGTGKITHQLAVANGSTDPTFSVWWTHNPSFNNPYDNNTIGASVSVPLRIFDRNQGEKARTQIDIGRNERLRDANQAQVFNDVDSAYVTLVSTVNLLRPYKSEVSEAGDRYSRQDFVLLPEWRGVLAGLPGCGESNRDTRLAYLNLIGSYLTAAAQMNMAVGREVLQ